MTEYTIIKMRQLLESFWAPSEAERQRLYTAIADTRPHYGSWFFLLPGDEGYYYATMGGTRISRDISEAISRAGFRVTEAEPTEWPDDLDPMTLPYNLRTKARRGRLYLLKPSRG